MKAERIALPLIRISPLRVQPTTGNRIGLCFGHQAGSPGQIRDFPSTRQSFGCSKRRDRGVRRTACEHNQLSVHAAISCTTWPGETSR